MRVRMGRTLAAGAALALAACGGNDRQDGAATSSASGTETMNEAGQLVDINAVEATGDLGSSTTAGPIGSGTLDDTSATSGTAAGTGESGAAPPAGTGGTAAGTTGTGTTGTTTGRTGTGGGGAGGSSGGGATGG